MSKQKERKMDETIMSKKTKEHVNSHSSHGNGMVVAATSTLVFVIVFLDFPSASASPSELILPRVFVGRNLLQAQKECPSDVQNWNYTIITSQCKGPRYPPESCCEAFKELACPYTEYLNDLSNNCATTMFSYINLYGSYPPGLFANTCRDSKRGLECTDDQKSAESSNNTAAGGAASGATPTIVLLLFPILHCIISRFL